MRGDENDLRDLVKRVRSSSEEEAMAALTSVRQALRDEGYAAGLAEALAGEPTPMTPDLQKAYAWASHERSAALTEAAIQQMERDGESPDLVAATKLLLGGLRTAQETLMGLASGVLTVVRVQPGNTLDCFQFDARPNT